MARLIKSEVQAKVSLNTTFLHDDGSKETVTCKEGDIITASYVENEEVKKVTGALETFILEKKNLDEGASYYFDNVPFYKDSKTSSVYFRKSGLFYIALAGVENGRVRVTNAKEKVGKKSASISGWVNVDDIKYGVGSDFSKEVQASCVIIDASEKYKSDVKALETMEIVDLKVGE